MTDASDAGGRVYFSSAGRDIIEEEEVRLLTVGVDIGSSTTHLVFSRLVLERLDSRYVVSQRELVHQSEVRLTPYAADGLIEAAIVGEHIAASYAAAGLKPEEIDTGALVLTGVAVRRQNARSVGELFSSQTGKMVAVSAGDGLETVMAAFGSGAVARSLREARTVVNIDIGGGTSKIAVCGDGEVLDRTAIDIGARVVVMSPDRTIVRLEEAGRWFANELGIDLEIGRQLSHESESALTQRMAELLFEALSESEDAKARVAPLLRLPGLSWRGRTDIVTISGGVSEYVYGKETRSFGDLGPSLAREVVRRAQALGLELSPPQAGIRATVIGASQFTTQVSGGTIYVEPLDALPLRNVPVIAPTIDWAIDEIDAKVVAGAISHALDVMDLRDTDRPVALYVRWTGTASFSRLDAFCRGALEGLASVLASGRPLVLVGDGDVGGLIGIHFKSELGFAGPIVSIDGLELKAFDFIDIGQMLADSGAVPVVIKSLIFPSDAGLGKPSVL